MSRTEEVKKILPAAYGAERTPEVKQAMALREIAITLAMMYDLMKETQKRDNPMIDDGK